MAWTSASGHLSDADHSANVRFAPNPEVRTRKTRVRFALKNGHRQPDLLGPFRANRRHPDVIQSPLKLARRPGPVRGDLCEEPAAQLAGNLLKGHCGRSTAADEAK